MRRALAAMGTRRRHGIDRLFTFCSYGPNRCRFGSMPDVLPLAAALAILLAGLAARAVLAWRAARRGEPSAADPQVLELARLQAETAVRIDAMREMLAGRQAELQRAVNERLDSVTHHLNQAM